MKTIIYIILALSFLIAPVVEAKDYGPFTYTTTVASGYEDDTLLIPELLYWAGSATLVGKYLYVGSTTDQAAPQNEACQIIKYTASSGEVILDTETEGAGNDASLGLSATITVNDVVWIMDSPPATALVRQALTAVKMASGIASDAALLYLTNVAEQCSAYVADGTSEIDTTGENTRAAVNAIHLMVADGTGEIDTTLENTRAAVALALAAVADGTGEVDTTLENVRAATLSIHTAISDGTGEIDTTLENTRAAVALVLAATADGTGEIDTTLENVRGQVKLLGDSTNARVSRLGYADCEVDTVSTPDGGLTTWTQAAHRLATVTGVCAVKVVGYCAETIVGAATVEVGVAGATDILIDQVANATTLAAGDVWVGQTADAVITAGLLESDWIIVSGTDIDITVGTADVTDGFIRFVIYWIPVGQSIGVSSSVAAAAWD